MSEDGAGAGAEGSGDGATEFTPITSQEDFDRSIAKRINQERAKFADYDDLKAKAGQLDQLAEASKTDLEKATDRIKALESEVQSTRMAASLEAIARENDLTDQQAKAVKLAPSEEMARELAEGFAAENAANTDARQRNGNRVRSEGGNPNPKPSNNFRDWAVAVVDGTT